MTAAQRPPLSRRTRWLVGAGIGAAFLIYLGMQSAPSSNCSSVPRSTLSAIAEGLTANGARLTDGAALRVGDWWYVAAGIDGPGLEGSGDIGVWAMPDKDDPGPIIMADAFAREFSQWGTQTGAENIGVWMRGSTAADCL